jgi:putative heme transporter
MSIFRHHDEQAEAGEVTSATGEAKSASAASPEPAEPQRKTPFVAPQWLRQFGLASWLLIGIAIIVVALVALTGWLMTLFVPTLFAALLGATFLPVCDWFERHHMKRWLATLLTMCVIALIFIVVIFIVVYGVFSEFPTVKANLSSGADDLASWMQDHHVDVSSQQLKSAFQKLGPSFISGAVNVVLKGINSISVFIFGVFIGINILAYFLADGRGIGRWMSHHLGPVPQPTAYRIIANAARFLRGYIWGSTLIGIFNGVIMFVGALVLGVPLAATIGIVGWFTNYIPTFGAIIGGAFAVLIALASGGLTTGILMLVVVLIANGPLQTVVSQFALGAALKLHPLAVLFATTAGMIMFGALGGIVAAPFLKIVMDAHHQLKAAGLFGDSGSRAEGSLPSDLMPGPPAQESGGAGPPGAEGAPAG